MHVCVSCRFIAAGVLALLVPLGGCQPQAASGLFVIEAVQARWTSGRIEVHCKQKLSLSEAARSALARGVPLTVELELILRGAENQTRIARDRTGYEIRYLPMSEHYQISRLANGQVKTYPRLRHALADLGTIDVSLETGALPTGDYELLARTRLDRNRMPPPMRLPILFDRAWKHASTWTSWPLSIDSGT